MSKKKKLPTKVGNIDIPDLFRKHRSFIMELALKARQQQQERKYDGKERNKSK